MRNFKIKHQLSKDVFILFCALNAFGYDDENNKNGMHPIRKKIRKILLGYNRHEKYPQLEKAIKTYHPWHLLKLIIAKPEKVKKTVLRDFTLGLKRFSNESSIQKLWEVFKTHQIQKAKKLFPLFEKETIQLMTFINRPTRELKMIVLIPNPLDAYWRGYGFGIGETGYIIVGPGAEKNHGELIRHELLHLFAPALRVPRWIITDKRHKYLTTWSYTNSSIVNREYVIRSLNLLYESAVLKMDISKAIKCEEKDFPHIREVLAFVKTEKEKGRL